MISENAETAPTNENTTVDKVEQKPEKNSIEVLRTLKNEQTTALCRVTKKRNELSKLMAEDNNLHLVKTALNELNTLFEQYQLCFETHTNMVTDESALDAEQKRYDDKVSSIMHYRSDVSDWICATERRLTTELECPSERSSRRSTSSRSFRSSRSRQSSRASERTKAKTKLAELLVEKSMRSQEQELQFKEYKLDLEIAKARARERILAVEEERESTEVKVNLVDSVVNEVISKSESLVNSHIGERMPKVLDNAINDVTLPVSNPSGVPKPMDCKHVEAPKDSTKQWVNTGNMSKIISNTEGISETTPNCTKVSSEVKAKYLDVLSEGQDNDGQLVQSGVVTKSDEVPTNLASRLKLSDPQTINAQRSSSRPTTVPKNLNPMAMSFSPFETHSQVDDPSNYHYLRIEQTQQLIAQQNQITAAMTLPQTQVPKFNGEVTEFNSFAMAFDSRIASRAISNIDRLYYLDQHLVGEPKDLIGGFLHLDPDTGYEGARALLLKEYGDPYKLSSAYMTKIAVWPQVKTDEAAGLRRFCCFLIKCKNAMLGVSEMAILNHAPNMQTVLNKLPAYIQNKWRSHAAQSRKERKRVMGFTDLVSFIEEESEAACDPIYSKDALRSYEQRTKLNNTSGQRASSFSTNVDVITDRPRQVENQRNSPRNCPACGGFHPLDVCKNFIEKSIEEKREYIITNRLCFGCLKSNHISKNCEQRLKCQKCNKRHPTSLHIENFSLPNSNPPRPNEDESTQIEQSSAAITTHCNNIILHSILPVLIQQRGTSNVVATYAFYDNGSSGCFITEELAEDLQAKGSETFLQLKTMHGVNRSKTTVIEGLEVTDLDGKNDVNLPRTFTQKEIPVSDRQIPQPEIFSQWPHLQDIAKTMKRLNPGIRIGLLIGNNCPSAIQPLQVIASKCGSPYVTRLKHGWTINGPVQVSSDATKHTMTCNHIQSQEIQEAKEVLNPHAILKILEQDFCDSNQGLIDEKGYSQEDRLFVRKVKDGINFSQKKFSVPLPFRNDNVEMPNNRPQALSRARWQRKKMTKDQTYFEHYTTFVGDIISKGYAEKVPENELKGTSGRIWYLPHHGVYNAHKPNKIRVVFDASARYEDRSLNDELLQGPDLANSLVGVLTRFREEDIAFMADIEAMFFQVRIPQDQYDYQRFLWWPDGNINSDPVDYRMRVHLFGAISSPSIVNFVLKHIADTTEHGELVKTTMKSNFYVDDCLRSVESEDIAINLIQDLRKACANGGFRLTKFICSNCDVLLSIPKDERSKEAQKRDLNYENLPIERALGIQWTVEEDRFGFSIMLNKKPLTRRGMLSTLCSVYDPLGFIAPCILPARIIVQELCQNSKLGWDDEVPQLYKQRWIHWITKLPQLSQIAIPRCFKPTSFGHLKYREMHVFCDVSSVGYGAVAYLLQENDSDQRACSFLIGKSRVAPTKITTIPRLELTAATVALQLGNQMSKELKVPPSSISYHTDSTTVLHYIRSEKRRFPIFVANRVEAIRKFSDIKQWRYVGTELNPADIASRGASIDQFMDSQTWLEGPAFIKLSAKHWPKQPENLEQETEEFDSTSVHATSAEENAATPTDQLISYYSNWNQLKRAIGIYLKVKDYLKEKSMSRKTNAIGNSMQKLKKTLTVEDIGEAENAIFRYIQRIHYERELKTIHQSEKDTERRGRVPKDSSIFRLNPYLANGLLRVGGRLSRANIPEETKHPILLPHKSHITKVIITDVHERLGHAGRNHVLAGLREQYWVTHGNASVRSIISACVQCRKERRPVIEQKMADLPEDRISKTPPFMSTGVDYFGPLTIKEGRKELKRYGVIFTCLASRAIHLETANSLDTDSFIHALRRFTARRGPVCQMRSDNGTNFVGAERELFRSIDKEKVQSSMTSEKIDWRFNPPGASHMGGIWERVIRSIRSTLTSLMRNHGTRLDDEGLRTLMTEVEAIVNSRPLTTVSSDVDDLQALTPAHLLTMKPSALMAPSGEFVSADIYARKRWRRVQYMTNLFWTRWQREYLVTLQSRQKWTGQRKNLQIGDVVP